VFEQAKNQYALSALRAFQEVSDNLIASQKLSAEEAQQNREVKALQESVAIARRRYLGGLASYYEVLEAQQLLYPAEINLSETSRDRRLAIVNLYRALGGGWYYSNAQLTNGHPCRCLRRRRIMRDVVVPLGLGIVLGLAGAVLTLAVATALAAYLPARRAARLDPMSALHDE
jgi:hypothetical protein